jgi:amino acid transporter
MLAVVTQQGTTSHFLPAAPLHASRGLLTAVGLAMISTLFAYDGWHFVGFVAGEIRTPERNVARSIFLGVAIVILAYVAANLAYIFVLGQARIAASDRVATDAMAAMIGPAGATIMTLAILCSIFGAISANVLAGPRVGFAMARDGRLPAWLGRVHPRYRTPGHAIWALAGWGGVLTLTGGFEHLITMSQFANWIFFTLVVFSVIVLRQRRPELERPYRVAGYPWTVVLFVIVSSVFVVNTLIEAPSSALMGLGLLLLGVPVYFRRVDR